MPRPTRIEYEEAFHHVMNRGRNGQTLFHNKSYFEIAEGRWQKILKKIENQLFIIQYTDPHFYKSSSIGCFE